MMPAFSEPVRATIIAILAFMAVVVVLGAVVLRLRRKAMIEQSGGVAGGFSVEKLEELHRTGQISKEEFSRLRRSLLGLAVRDEEKKPSSSSSTMVDDDEEDGEEDPCVNNT